jgi:iron-sulfur cluster repair protein YtfE (RIC family)
MAVATNTVTINAAFLREIKEDHRDLWRLLDEVRHLCAEWPLSRRRLANRLARLRDRLAMHFTLEEAFGYFDDPLDVAPRLARQAETLRSQHGELYLALARLADEADTVAHGIGTAQRLRRLAGDCRRFDKSLLAHEHLENQLILEAFDEDIGVGD